MNDQSIVLEDAAKLASRKGLSKFTGFLDPAQAALSEQIARSHGAAFSSWGGYADAERVVGCFHPHGEMPENENYPLVCLHSRIHSKFCTVTHRDLLGSFMALGLTRASIGDIIVSDSDVYLFARAQIADFIAVSLTSAGKMSLDFRVLDTIPEMPDPQGTAFHGVVSSLRLDAVLACAYHLSRSEAADCIRAGLVKVDHIPCERIDFLLKEGTLLSCKGRGRMRLTEINGMTRKQRIGITLFRYE